MPPGQVALAMKIRMAHLPYRSAPQAACPRRQARIRSR